MLNNNYNNVKIPGINNIQIVSEYFSLVPKSQKHNLNNKIRRHYKYDLERFISDFPLFGKLFTVEDKKLCEKNFEDLSKQERKLQKAKLLWSSQLLGLVGKNGSAYLNSNLMNRHNLEIERKEKFIASLGAVDGANGKKFNLPKLEDRLKQKQAELLKISKTMEKLAKDRKYTWAMITLTLPPSYHCNPTIGTNSFSGVDPLKSHNTLQNFWKLILAQINKKGYRAEKDFFGLGVFEAHKDSTLHKHILIYANENTIIDIKGIVKSVELTQASIHNEKLKFDFKVYDPNYKNKNGSGSPAQGASYVYKYLVKTNSAMGKDSTVNKNVALRSYYSARGYDLLGFDRCLSVYRYLYRNLDNGKHKSVFCKDLITCLEDYDLYKFITVYKKYFKAVRTKTDIDFVVYDLKGNDNGFTKKYSQYSHYIVKRRNLGLYEKTEDNEKFANVKMLDKSNIGNSGCIQAYENAKFSREQYQLRIDEYMKSHSYYAWLKFDKRTGKPFNCEVKEEFNYEIFDKETDMRVFDCFDEIRIMESLEDKGYKFVDDNDFLKRVCAGEFSQYNFSDLIEEENQYFESMVVIKPSSSREEKKSNQKIPDKPKNETIEERNKRIRDIFFSD